jgi:hypothetical protein
MIKLSQEAGSISLNCQHLHPIKHLGPGPVRRRRSLFEEHRQDSFDLIGLDVETRELPNFHLDQAEAQIMPRHCAHHHEDHDPSKKKHIKSPIPGMLDSSEPLGLASRVVGEGRRVRLPPLWVSALRWPRPGESLFKCLDTDGADHQIYQAIAWMWVHESLFLR